WSLTADEDDDGGEVKGDGGMEMAAAVVAADEDGGDVVGSGGDVDGGCGVEGGGDVTAVVTAMVVLAVGGDEVWSSERRRSLAGKEWNRGRLG
ncbi:hypothetical protein Tco_1261959, partial [Tanacetum coccineum]